MRFSQIIRARVSALVVSLATMFALAVTMLAPVGTALASAAPSGQPVAVHTIPLSVDCSRVPDTAQAHAILSSRNLCGFGKAGGGVSPDNAVSGNCGTLSLYVYNSGNGYLQWKAEITSSAGPFISASYSGSWANTTNGGNGPVNRSYSGWTSDWLDIFPIYTGAGQVFGRINSATDTLWWGGLCSGAGQVDDYAYVSNP